MDPKIVSEYAAKIASLSNGEPGAGGEVSCTLAAAGNVRSFTISAAGTGYSLGDVLTCSDATFTVTAVDENGAVTTATLLTGGAAIVDLTGAATTVAPAGGTGCKLSIVAQFPIDTVTIDEEGDDYITALASLSGGDGTGGEIALTVTAGAITDTDIVEAGNYRTAPTIQVIAGPLADGAAWITALTDFDSNYLNERLATALGIAESTVVINANARAGIDEMRAGIDEMRATLMS